MPSSKKALRLFLDVLFPRAANDARLLALSPETFGAYATPAVYDDMLETLGACALFSYRDSSVRRAVHLLKFRRGRAVADLFGALLYDTLLEDLADRVLLENANDIRVVPIPLSREHLHTRGFNQAALIAHSFAKRADLTFEERALARANRPSQTQMPNRPARLENARGSFSIPHPERVKNKNVILVDDVITTGATMREAKNALLSAGARSVWCVAVAH